MTSRATRTINLAKESIRDRRSAVVLSEAYPDGVYRPRTRGECARSSDFENEGDARRPCPFVSCRHHLALDISSVPANGNPPSLSVQKAELRDLPETCALDVADHGGLTLADVAEILGLTRERVRQIEVSALRKLRAAFGGVVFVAEPSTSGLAMGARELTLEDEPEPPPLRQLPFGEAWDLSARANFGEATLEVALARVGRAYDRALEGPAAPPAAGEQAIMDAADLLIDQDEEIPA